MEAQQRTEEVDEMILAKYHSAVDLTKVGTNNYDLTPIAQVGANSNWTKITGQIFCSESFFDLAGLAMESKTIIPTGITCQRGNSPLLQGATPGDNFIMLDVLTSIPVSINPDVLNWFNVGPGFPGSTLNFEHVLYMRGQRWTVDVDTNSQFPLMADEWQSGSMASTASDRVYSYRVVLVNTGNQSARIITPSGRHVMDVEAKEEPTYEYLMRLKRSYDLQNGPDVD